jgi:hypothetical protein
VKLLGVVGATLTSETVWLGPMPITTGPNKRDKRTLRDDVAKVIDIAIAEFGRANLPTRMPARLARLKDDVESTKAKDFDIKAVRLRVQDLACDLFDELSEPVFLHIPFAEKELYEQKEPMFGQLVADKFPDSAREIAAAGRCLALEEPTAGVAHLMRALESPLQVIAAEMGVTFKKGPNDLENWKNLIDNIEAKIEEDVARLEQTAKSHERNNRLKRLAEIALDFRHFKNAWRNDVAHGREWYDKPYATKVFDAVKSFMQKMAEVA